MLKPLLVGESNPYSSDDEDALLPWPRGATGDRLRRILALSDKEYLATFDRANLLPTPRWSKTRAAVKVSQLHHVKRVLLGARVASAHGLPYVPFHEFFREGYRLLVLPHPSGRCRIWNDRSAAGKARAAVRKFLEEREVSL